MDPILNQPAFGLEVGTYGGLNINAQGGAFRVTIDHLLIGQRRLFSFMMPHSTVFRIDCDHFIANAPQGLLYGFQANMQRCTQHCLVFMNPGDGWVFDNPPNSPAKVVRAVWELDTPLLDNIVVYVGQTVSLIAKPGHTYRVSVLDQILVDMGHQAVFNEGQPDEIINCVPGADMDVNLTTNTRTIFTVGPLQYQIHGRILALTIIRIRAIAQLPVML